MTYKIPTTFAEYICQHDQGILQRGDDTDIDVAERAWAAAVESKAHEIAELKEKLEKYKQAEEMLLFAVKANQVAFK